MPGGKTKFQEKWLSVTDNSGDVISKWCSKGRSAFEVYCSLCSAHLSISNSGVKQLLQHANGLKHTTAAKQLKHQKTLSFVKTGCGETSCSSISIFNNDRMVTQAETLWAIKVAVSNFSFSSCKDIVPLFKVMFGDSSISNGMKLGERKMSYLLSHGLGPYFHNKLLEDLKASISSGCYFTLEFDETTTSQVKKQLDIYVRFWSTEFGGVISAYLTSLFFGHAEAPTVFKEILTSLEKDKLPLNKLLMLSMDGPNVNLSIAKKFNVELDELGSPDLVDIGTCTLHKIHNCFRKALDDMPFDVDEFAMDLFCFFKHSAARREDFKMVENLMELDEVFLLRHVSSRWLSIGPVIERILSIYPALKEYFLKVLPKQRTASQILKNSRYKRIVSGLKDPSTVSYLEFISSFSVTLQMYLKLFQSEGPLVHLLYSKMNSLLKVIMMKFIKEEHIKGLEGKHLCLINIEDSKYYCKLKDIDIGTGAQRALSYINENEAKVVTMAIRAFLIKICLHLKETLPLRNVVLRDLEKLHPIMRSLPTTNALRRLCKHMKPLKFNDHMIDIIIVEWQTYRLDSDVDEIYKGLFSLDESNQRIDKFWQQVFSLTDKHTGELKYTNLARLVKNCLSLSHGNADVERGFSLNKSFLTNNRTSLADSVIIAIRQVKDTVHRFGGISSISITPELLNSVAKAHSAFLSAKEEAKKMEEEQTSKKKRDEENEIKAREIKRAKLDNEQKIKDLDLNIKTLEDDLCASKKCLLEGNQRLQVAIKKKDFLEMKVASTLIEAATEKIDKTTSEICKKQNKKAQISVPL